jgi:hypothetical protein
MYKASSQPGAGQAGPQGGPSSDGKGAGDQAKEKDNVVDAEFVDVDDKK